MATEDPPYRIPLHPVSSSNIEAIGYDDAKKILAVKFLSGAVFHYASVEADTALDLLHAESVGRYYTKNIKGKFAGAKMTGPCVACDAQGYIGDPCACGQGQHSEVERPAAE